MNKIKKAAELIKNSEHTIVLTGAGISTAAGIPDFRGKNGIYKTNEYDPMKTFDYNYFKKDPSHFFKFAKEFVKIVEEINPTETHYFLADLEKKNKINTVITQNIDGLHKEAGSKNVLSIHGDFRKGHCLKCSKTYSFGWMKNKLKSTGTLYCKCGGIVKPEVVFFGEPVKNIYKCQTQAQKADLFIVMGSSLTVQPAAMLPMFTNGYLLIINKGKVALPKSDIDLRINDELDKTIMKIKNYL